MDVVNLLTKLLLQEYQQRDLYETYGYYLYGLSSPAIQAHLTEHLKQEMQHIEILQRYLMELEADPVIVRLEIPRIEPPIENILKKDLELEREAVKNYSLAIRALEDTQNEQFIALRVDLENILVQEQEHVHDLIQWLR